MHDYDPAAFLEDAEWLAQTGAGFDEAARRLHLTRTGLEKRLRTHGRRDLLERFGAYAAVARGRVSA